ncbi:hypothetical protein D2Q93_14710 [Alicyclobacillaceae bacterium I2511]|nr:hypothetical protein D2Q93_14710 [Alicyclobacillaceae bacterium I2511]
MGRTSKRAIPQQILSLEQLKLSQTNSEAIFYFLKYVEQLVPKVIQDLEVIQNNSTDCDDELIYKWAYKYHFTNKSGPHPIYVQLAKSVISSKYTSYQQKKLSSVLIYFLMHVTPKSINERIVSDPCRKVDSFHFNPVTEIWDPRFQLQKDFETKLDKLYDLSKKEYIKRIINQYKEDGYSFESEFVNESNSVHKDGNEIPSVDYKLAIQFQVGEFTYENLLDKHRKTIKCILEKKRQEEKRQYVNSDVDDNNIIDYIRTHIKKILKLVLLDSRGKKFND